MTIAALSSVLALYLDKDRLAARLPTLRLLSRPLEDIAALAGRLRPQVEQRLGGAAAVDTEECRSQIGSGALPVDLLPSVALRLRPRIDGRGRGKALSRLAAAFRALPVPVIGRIQNDAFLLDLRCLEDEAAFLEQLSLLDLS
jgi:L-seryl-tRNA(Ser) seleniumtransferase